jgi:uroporphyrin-3 C-methyltransferase
VQEKPEKIAQAAPSFHESSASAHASSQEKFSYAGAASPPGVPPYIPPESDFNDANRGNRGIFWPLVMTGAILVLGYFTYASTTQLHELQKKADDDQASVLAVSEQAKKSLQEMTELSNHYNVEQKSLLELKQQVEQAQSRLVDLSGSSDWLLAEANYLAFMANERLRTAQDVTTAVAQLSAADERLKTMSNPALLWVRQIIAKDLAKLHTYPMVNRQEIWERVGLLSNEINQLHFKRLSESSVDNEKETQAPQDESMSGWKKALFISWQELKSLIRITRLADNAIAQALTSQEQAQILRAMQLYCEQARWAILHGDSKVYINSLESLKTWISQYFMADNISEQMLLQITQLQQQRADIAVPDISESLQALSKAMLDAQNKQTPPSVAQPQPMKGGVQ